MTPLAIPIIALIAVLGGVAGAAILYVVSKASRPHVRFSKRVLRTIAVDATAGIVSGLAARRAVKHGAPTVTIFGPGIPSVGKP